MRSGSLLNSSRSISRFTPNLDSLKVNLVPTIDNAKLSMRHTALMQRHTIGYLDTLPSEIVFQMLGLECLGSLDRLAFGCTCHRPHKILIAWRNDSPVDDMRRFG